MTITILNQKFTLGEVWKIKGSLIWMIMSPRKIVNFLQVKLSLLGKNVSVNGYPYVLMIEASSFCDMVCPMCPIEMEGTMRKRGEMAYEKFRKLMEEIGDTTMAICFWNFGEPLLNKNIFRMIREAKKYNIFTAISTNLLSLNDCQKQEKLMECGLDYLIISFDGATQDTYEKFRGKGNFYPVLTNLKELLVLKRKKSLKLPFVNLQFIIMKDNEKEISLIRNMSKELGVDKLSLKKFTYIGNNAESFLPENSDYILGKHKSVTNMNRCARPWDSTVISWDGEVLPCCGDLKFSCKHGNCFGEDSFKTIWNSKRYKTFRKRVLDDINNIPMCKTCPSTDFTTDMFVE